VLTPIECSERAEEAIADALCCPHIETMLPGVLNRSPEAAQCAHTQKFQDTTLNGKRLKTENA
jgi:hypothetical protein